MGIVNEAVDTEKKVEEIQAPAPAAEEPKEDRFQQIVRLLTDPENQPHQYVGNPEGLAVAILDSFGE